VLTEAEIERLRQSGLRLDRAGRFWHEGELVTHERMLEAFHRWIDRLDDGRYVLRLDERRFVYIDVEDTPFVARSLRWEGDRALVTLQSGREEPLDPAPLVEDAHGVVGSVRAGRFPVRLSTRAWQSLTERAIERDGRLHVTVAGVDLPL
jgi:hypothetical protein